MLSRAVHRVKAQTTLSIYTEEPIAALRMGGKRGRKQQDGALWNQSKQTEA